MNQPSSAQFTEHTQNTSGVTGLGEQQFMTMLTKEVIPRLVLLEEETAQFGSPPVNSLQAAALALSDLSVEKDLSHCQNAIAALIREGHSVEQILLEVVQPAARLLGQRWNEDSCNFADVTLGMWNIQQVFTDLAVTMRHTRSGGGIAPDQLAPSVLFCTLPNCHHRLGVQMVSAFFLRAGWNTQLVQGRSETELLHQIAGFAPDLLGLSVSSEADILGAADFIRRVRGLPSPIGSGNGGPNGPLTLGIMLGGPATKVFPELAREAGADLLAGDAPEALAAAEAFIKKDADRGPR